MAYGLKYYKELTHPDGKVVRLEILEKNGTATAKEIGPVCQALRLDIQGDTEIDAPIVKTSLTMTFVDAPDLEEATTKKCGDWRELYTPDATKWQVILKCKKEGDSSYKQIWGGYITPDSFTESLIYRGSVTIVARDNIGHMQDFPFDAEGENGMINLADIITKAWNKIDSPMEISMADAADEKWLYCEGVRASNTYMNVSHFDGMNWFDALESALYAYGLTMRYVGNNKVHVTALRNLPLCGKSIANDVASVAPKFMAGAEHELTPAVRQIEEIVDYEVSQSVSDQVKSSDYTGASEDVWILGNEDNAGGIVNPIINKERGQGWCNPADSLFFNPKPYNFLGNKDDDRRYMWLTCNTAEGSFSRYAEYSLYARPENISLSMRFGLPYSLGVPVRLYPNGTLYSCEFAVIAVEGGITKYLTKQGEWVTDVTKIEMDMSENSEFSLAVPLAEYQNTVLLRVVILRITTSESNNNAASYIPLYHLSLSCDKPVLSRNTVKTLYNSSNNVILSREPKIAPALNDVAFTRYIENGIFFKSGDSYLPAKAWNWDDQTPQQMAVYNHLQLLCYHFKPNSILRGTIVNADITDHAVIYTWESAEHMLVSGSLNFISGHIENAVLREFARYDQMWGMLDPADFPDVDADSSTNANEGTKSATTTYENTTTVNIGGAGGNIILDDYMSDTSENGVMNRVIKGYVDGEIAEILKMWRIEDGHLMTDMDVYINANLIVKKNSASGGTNDPSTNIGTVDHIVVNGKPYYPDNAGIVDLSEAFEGLSGGGDIDLSGYLKTTDVPEWAKKSTLAVADVPDLSAKYLSVDGGTLNGGLTMSSGNLVMSGGKGHIVTNEVYPTATDTYYLGSDSRRWKNVTTQNINGYTPIHSGNIRSQHVTYAEKLTTGTYQYATFDAANKYVAFGDFAAKSGGYATYIDGSNIYLRVNGGNTIGLSIDSSGNVVIEKNLIVKGNSASGGTSSSNVAYVNAALKLVTSSEVAVLSAETSNGVNYTTNNGCLFIKPTTDYSYDQGIRIGCSTSQQISAIWLNAVNRAGYDAGMWGITCVKGGNLRFRGGASSASDIINLTQSGEVLIGATAAQSHKFYVNGTSRFADRVCVGKDVAQQTSGRSQLSVVSTTDLPCDLILGANAPHWSITARNSTDAGSAGPYGFVIYSYRHSSYRLYIKDNGYVYTASNIIAGGSVTQNSDMRIKNKRYDYLLDLQSIANAPLFAFHWNNGLDADLHIGTSAQYWEAVTPQLVLGDKIKSLDYSTLGVAMGISLAKTVLSHEDRIKTLESENKALKQQLNEISNGSVC